MVNKAGVSVGLSREQGKRFSSLAALSGPWRGIWKKWLVWESSLHAATVEQGNLHHHIVWDEAALKDEMHSIPVGMQVAKHPALASIKDSSKPEGDYYCVS